MPEQGSMFSWPSRRERILALTSELVDALRFEKVDLNQVDGEFFWKICRDDVFGPLSEVAARHAPRRAEGRIQIDQVYADVLALRTTTASWAQEHPFVTDYARVGKEIPRSVLRRLLNGMRIPMREPMLIYEDESVPGVRQ